MAHISGVTGMDLQGRQTTERISNYHFSLILFQSPTLHEAVCNLPHNSYLNPSSFSGDLCQGMQTNTVSEEGVGQFIAFSGLNVSICVR